MSRDMLSRVYRRSPRFYVATDSDFLKLLSVHESFQQLQLLLLFRTNGTVYVDPPVSYTGFQKAMMVQVAVVNFFQIVKELVQIYQQVICV